MRRLLWLLVGLGGLAAAVDGLRRRRVDPRAFDPGALAAQETALWRSYYDRDRLAFVRQTTGLLRTQFGLSPTRAALAALAATVAAAVFQRGRAREDHQQALPALRAFYRLLGRDSVVHWDPQEAAERELEWWIVHREVADRGRRPLETALARSAATLYGLPEEALAEHAALRAAAMLLRDEAGARDAVRPDEWDRIADLLRGSWTSLHTAGATVPA